MESLIAGFGLLLLISSPVGAEHLVCSVAQCPTDVELVSLDQGKVYGLLLAAPQSGCRRMRYRVETPELVLLGKTPALGAGEVAVVRIGDGFQNGMHTLIVTGEGCSTAPVLLRRVTLEKRSPDHGWRAAIAISLLTKD